MMTTQRRAEGLVSGRLAPDGRPDDQGAAAGFIDAMSGAVTQVTVVTTDGPAGRFGVTVSAFASISAEPSLVMVCINRRSPAIPGIEANGRFCVNLLSEDQASVADCFAGRGAGVAAYDFACADWGEAATGAPVLRGACASFDCMLESATEAGTHCMLVGKVMAAQASERRALAFSRRAYQALGPLERNETT